MLDRKLPAADPHLSSQLGLLIKLDYGLGHGLWIARGIGSPRPSQLSEAHPGPGAGAHINWGNAMKSNLGNLQELPLLNLYGLSGSKGLGGPQGDPGRCGITLKELGESCRVSSGMREKLELSLVSHIHGKFFYGPGPASFDNHGTSEILDDADRIFAEDLEPLPGKGLGTLGRVNDSPHGAVLEDQGQAEIVVPPVFP